MKSIPKSSLLAALPGIIFLGLFNLLLISIPAYLTMDIHANGNSRFGAVLLSFFIPAFLVLVTRHLSPIVRLVRFGTGYFCHIILALVIVGLPLTMVTYLGPCLVISLATLYYGDVLFNKKWSPTAHEITSPEV